MPNKLQSFLILIFSFFTFFMTVIAPLELRKVKQAKTWERVNAVVIGAEYKPAPFNRNSKYLEFSLRETQTLNGFKIVDARPGDFPLTVNLFGWQVYDSNQKLLGKYKINEQIEVIISPDHRKYFFEAGNYRLMGVLFLLSIAWWVYVIWYIIKLRKAAGYY